MPDTFTANLEALRRHHAPFAQRLTETEPAALTWSASKAGPLTAVIERPGKPPLALASRFDPFAEAGKLAASVDFKESACAVVLGLGLGYHVTRVAEALGASGLLIVFEPDVALWRAVLERIDHRSWLGRRGLIIADDTTDRATLIPQAEMYTALLTQGTRLVVHPPSRQLHGEAVQQFSQTVTETIAYCRTNVATALVNAATTCRNLTGNLGPYAAGANANELHDAAKGYPAVCVAAGPSLAKNVDLLRDPAVRQNVIVIAVQTALRPLLDRDIRPDFVTALDYSPICKRFYENLPELPDVTLVADPKAHPVIFDSYPGPIRVIPSDFNDRVLGEMSRPMIRMRSGATVAHLSFYLAQHLGCDPIIFIGQDLGFSDGLYYAPGTAVHQVWSSELGRFNTIEMMEWQRVVRSRSHLQRITDVHGRSIYSDEQMLTYLKQFERDFAIATQTVLDATEGGSPKAHATPTTLAEALAEHATRPAPALPVPPRELDDEKLAALHKLMDRRMREMEELKLTTQKTIPILRQMQKHQGDKLRMDKLFHKLHKQQTHVHRDLARPFTLVSDMNTLAAYKRARADRHIAQLQSSDGTERQKQQLERDIINLKLLIESCDEALSMFHDAADRVAKQRKRELAMCS